MAQITWTQIREAYVALLGAQKTATPTLLRKVERYRPGSVHDAPVAWIGNQNEAITYDSGTRGRTVITEVEIATRFKADVLTSSDEFDQLVDALRERFTQTYNAVPDTVLELVSIETVEQVFAGVDKSDIYRGLTLTVNHRIWENRL